MNGLTALESQVIQMLLSGDDEALLVLREQAQQATVSSREITGVGFFTEFTIPPEAPRINGCPTFTLCDVNGSATNVRHGLGFVLFVTDGALEMLEGYTYDEPWPDEISGLALMYSTGESRNLEDLKKAIRAG